MDYLCGSSGQNEDQSQKEKTKLTLFKDNSYIPFASSSRVVCPFSMSSCHKGIFLPEHILLCGTIVVHLFLIANCFIFQGKKKKERKVL